MEAAMSLEGLSVRELEALQDQVARAIETRRAVRAQELREEFQKRVEEEGLVLDSVVGSAKGRPRPRPVARYQNPANPDETWAGRGRKPKWLIDAVKNGTQLEELAI